MGNSDRIVLGDMELALIKRVRQLRPEYHEINDREIAKQELRYRLFDVIHMSRIHNKVLLAKLVAEENQSMRDDYELELPITHKPLKRTDGHRTTSPLLSLLAGLPQNHA